MVPYGPLASLTCLPEGPLPNLGPLASPSHYLPPLLAPSVGPLEGPIYSRFLPLK